MAFLEFWLLLPEGDYFRINCTSFAMKMPVFNIQMYPFLPVMRNKQYSGSNYDYKSRLF